MDPRVFDARLGEARRAIDALSRAHAELSALVDAVGGVLSSGGTVLTCGNGGSAAEALHLAEELVGRYRATRPPCAGLCLNADPTALTCIANDFGFEHVFSRQVEALGRRGDLLLVFSTSGRSANLLRALEVARAKGVRTAALLGGDGGPARALCDIAVIIGGVDGAAVQEAHQMALHIICQSLEPAGG